MLDTLHWLHLRQTENVNLYEVPHNLHSEYFYHSPFTPPKKEQKKKKHQQVAAYL